MFKFSSMLLQLSNFTNDTTLTLSNPSNTIVSLLIIFIVLLPYCLPEKRDRESWDISGSTTNSSTLQSDVVILMIRWFTFHSLPKMRIKEAWDIYHGALGFHKVSARGRGGSFNFLSDALIIRHPCKPTITTDFDFITCQLYDVYHLLRCSHRLLWHGSFTQPDTIFN